MENELMIRYNIIAFLADAMMTIIVCFLPVVIIKKKYPKIQDISYGKKVAFTIAMAIITSTILIYGTFFLRGDIPNTWLWIFFMFYNHRYLFGKKEKDNKAIDYDALYAEMDEIEAEKNSVTVENPEAKSAKDSIADDVVI